jgi:hypothetical protein
MKTWATLAAAAALTIGSAAHAGEPVKLDETALDSVTAGRFFDVRASTLFASAGFAPGTGSASTVESSFASGKRTATPGSETLSLLAKASGRSLASGVGGIATASGGGFVFINVFSAPTT